jgi:hypothetical protein
MPRTRPSLENSEPSSNACSASRSEETGSQKVQAEINSGAMIDFLDSKLLLGGEGSSQRVRNPDY